MDNENAGYDYIVTPYQEKIPELLSVSYIVFWAIFSTLLIAFDVFSIHKFQESKHLIIPHVVMGILPGLLAISTVWFSKILENFTPSLFMFIDWPKEKILGWYTSKIRSIFSGRKMVLAGLIMTVVIMPLSFIGPLMPEHIVSKICFLAIVVSLDFLAGSLFYVLIGICVMVHDLGKIESIKISVYQHPLSSIKAVGRLMGQIAFVTMLIYFFGVSYQIFTRPDKIMVFMTIFFGVFVLFVFIFPQIKIHNIMFKVKYQKLKNFSLYLEDSLERVTENPSPENIQRVKELFGIQQSLSEMGEWPFDIKIFFTILTGIATPFIIAIIQVIFGG